MIKFLKVVLLFPLLLLFYSCGGDEVESVPGNSTESSNVDSGAPKLEPVEEVVEEKPDPEVLPNPNGVYLPTDEEKNGMPVYANGEGFFMWFNGSLWKISDKSGGGKIISTGKESLRTGVFL